MRSIALTASVPSLPASFTDEELEHHLRSLLSQYGSIVSTRAGRDKKQRPYCFVQFKVRSG